MVWNENGIRPNGLDHLSTQGNFTPPGCNRRPVAFVDVQRASQLRVNLDARFRILIDQGTDSSCLRPREKMADNTAGRENDRILIVHVFRRRRVFCDIESRFAIRKVERTGAVGN